MPQEDKVFGATLYLQVPLAFSALPEPQDLKGEGYGSCILCFKAVCFLSRQFQEAGWRSLR